MTTTGVSNLSAGTGKPSSSKTAMHPSIASLMLMIASSLVSPWLTQPGRLGHSATQ